MAGLPESEVPEGFDDYQQADNGSDFSYEAGPDDYPAALDMAARLMVNLEAAAADDAKIIAVSTSGRVQIIGTGKRWPSCDMVILEGPCILVYGKDAAAHAASLAAPK